MMLSYLIVCFLNMQVLVEPRQGKRQVLLLSFDGFRWDYAGKYHTPNLDWIARTGVQARRGIRTAFVTKTFPDHYTIATGLYEENHGIVNNKMYDPVYDEIFTKRNKDPKWWDGGEPLWITAKLQGLRTGTYFWPGSEVNFRGIMPDAYLTYNEKISFRDRIDTAIKWLVEDKLDLVVAYFHEPDKAGHKYGAFSFGVEEAVREVDDTLGYLIDRLKEYDVLDNIDIIIVSDHGMTNVTWDKEHLINLNNYLNISSDVKYIPQIGAVGGIWPNNGKEDEVYNKLKNSHPHMTVYKKEELPERYHYKHNRRICPILAIADEGYYITYNSTDQYEKLKNVTGQHGYDNDLPSMHPIFYARGPDFKMNYTRDEFDTVNIYPLICHLLGIKPSPNNGSLSNIKDILTNESNNEIERNNSVLNSVFSTMFMLVTLVMILFSV
ncbi:ectonucleotide pyrophosphatase/phosphodiesterase family member 5-like [Centruroides sculpturatus]|uniref:ectonucleotide pyrophosphatase/phosphodiesterase family member 5-like n=1 Tax=Centruroides sculpturatus TaxID=218467 RepID=UPI000C6D7908|nr:ectonucleotide pyrophosphatase/phosphodiesterase family member 5-like [Centruroides sculpturatus]